MPKRLLVIAMETFILLPLLVGGSESCSIVKQYYHYVVAVVLYLFDILLFTSLLVVHRMIRWGWDTACINQQYRYCTIRLFPELNSFTWSNLWPVEFLTGNKGTLPVFWASGCYSLCRMCFNRYQVSSAELKQPEMFYRQIYCCEAHSDWL